MQHLSKKSTKILKITKNLTEPCFTELKTPQSKLNSLKTLEKINFSSQNSEFIPFRKNSGFCYKNIKNFGLSPKLNSEKKLRILTNNYETVKKSQDFPNSARSCSQTVLKEKKIPETSFLPQITKNPGFEQRKLTNSCNGVEGLRLPSIQKVSKFKSNQIKINF